MLKCRFRVSLHHLFTGYSGFVSAIKIVPPITSIQLKGFESLKRSLHTSTDDGDDFAELGLPVERVGGLIRKLMTEKPEPFIKINGTEKKLHRVSRKVGNSSVSPLDLQNNNGGVSDFKTSHSVTIKNVPSTIDAVELEEAISVFGKVSKASKRLNSTVMDESKWSADLQNNESPSNAMSENGNVENDLGLNIVGHLADLEREILMKKIYVEDLQHLRRCVLHLENDPLKC